MTTFTTDNRWSPGASGATVPDNALAAYAARWIDLDTTADVLGDRQGFAYNSTSDRDELIKRLVAADAGIRGYLLPAEYDETTVVVDNPDFTVTQRRAGGYVYCEAVLLAVTA